MMKDLLPFAIPFIGLFNVFRRMWHQAEFRALLVVEVVLLGSGTLFYQYIEHWNWIDALYFCVVTLATVGYGDLHPTTQVGRLFTIPFIIVGVAMLGVFIQLAGRTTVEAIQQRAEQIEAKRRALAEENSAPKAEQSNEH